MSLILWERLDPNTVEQAIKALIAELHPGARPVDGRGGDRGRDVRWDSPEGLVVFEIKSYSGDRLKPGQRTKIAKSLARAAEHRPVRWVLVLPMDHSPSEESWFDRLQAKYSGIELGWLGVSWLNVEFGKREHLRRLVEDESYELLRRAREFEREQAVLGGGVTDAINRFLTLHTRAQELSPFWRPDFLTTPNGVRVVYRERYPGAADLDPVQLHTTFSFPIGDTAASDVQQHLNDVLDYGGDIEVDGRYVEAFAVLASPASRALFDASGPMASLRITSVAEQLAEPPSYHLVVVSPTGKVKHRLALQMEPPTAGAKGVRLTGRDSSGTFEVVANVDRPEHGGSARTHVNGRGISGRYPYEVRPAFELFRHVEPGDRLEIRIDDRSLGHAADMDAFLAEARQCGDLVAALEALQNHSGVRFRVPDDITRVDAQDLILAAQLLDGQQVRSDNRCIKLEIRPEKLEEFLEMREMRSPGGLVVEQDKFAVACGPHRIELGSLRIVAPQLHLANVGELQAAVGTGIAPVARFSCIDDGGIYMQLTTAPTQFSAVV